MSMYEMRELYERAEADPKSITMDEAWSMYWVCGEAKHHHEVDDGDLWEWFCDWFGEPDEDKWYEGWGF